MRDVFPKGNHSPNEDIAQDFLDAMDEEGDNQGWFIKKTTMDEILCHAETLLEPKNCGTCEFSKKHSVEKAGTCSNEKMLKLCRGSIQVTEDFYCAYWKKRKREKATKNIKLCETEIHNLSGSDDVRDTRDKTVNIASVSHLDGNIYTMFSFPDAPNYWYVIDAEFIEFLQTQWKIHERK